MTKARAADARLRIAGVPYAVQNFRRTGRVNPIGVANTEGIPGNSDLNTANSNFDAVLPDIRSGEFTVRQAVFDDENNPYAAPVSLVEGGYYELVWFPSGLAGPSADLGFCLCTECGEEGTVGNGAVIPYASFRTDGQYSIPGEV